MSLQRDRFVVYTSERAFDSRKIDTNNQIRRKEDRGIEDRKGKVSSGDG